MTGLVALLISLAPPNATPGIAEIGAARCDLIRSYCRSEISAYSPCFSNNLWRMMASSMVPSLSSLSLQQIGQGLDHGDFSVKQLTEAHLTRIEQLNSSLHAVLQVNPAVIQIATALDDELKRFGRRG